MIHLFTSKTERREGASKTDTKYRRLHFRGERTTIQRSIYVKNRHNIGWPDTRNIVKAFCIYYCERVGVLFSLDLSLLPSLDSSYRFLTLSINTRLLFTELLVGSTEKNIVLFFFLK